MALANEDSPVFVAPGQSVVAACFMDLEPLIAAFRGNGAFPWGEHHHRMFHGVEKFFRPGLPGPPDHVVAARPGRRGGQAPGRGQGGRRRLRPRRLHGHHGQGLPRTPGSSASTSTPPRSRWREKRAAEAGVGARVTFTTATAQSYAERGFDLICFFDCLHDMGDPVGAARHALPGPQGRRHRAAGRALRRRQPGRELDSGGTPLLRRVDHGLHAELAVPGGRARARRPGRRVAASRRSSPRPASRRFRRATETPFNLILEARK